MLEFEIRKSHVTVNVKYSIAKQRIGTTISMKNSGLMLYPSLTFCQQPGQGNDTTLNTLTHTPNLSDVVFKLEAFDRPNNAKFIVTPENRDGSLFSLHQISK